MIESKVFLYSSLYAVFNVFGAAIMKNKLLTVKISGFREFLFFLIDPVILIALFAIFISMFFSIKSLSIADFSSVIPVMTAINFIITVTVGLVFFKDIISTNGYIGLFLIIAGIYMISKG
jgi:multidrug transporter EmrE-like cation transporter